MFSVLGEPEPHPGFLVRRERGTRKSGRSRVSFLHQSQVKDFFIFCGGFILETGITKALQVAEHAAADDVSFPWLIYPLHATVSDKKNTAFFPFCFRFALFKGFSGTSCSVFGRRRRRQL